MKTKRLALEQAAPKSRFVKNLYNYRYAYILMAPAMIAVFLFYYLPLAGVVLAF